MHTELGSSQVGSKSLAKSWRRVGKVGKAEVEVELADMVRRNWKEEEARRRRRRRRRTASRGGGGEQCALIKSNNPHLAGGEKCLKPPTSISYKL